MSETDALLPVTTTTRQRKTQQVIAARSSVGDTLVEISTGLMIGAYPSINQIVAAPLRHRRDAPSIDLRTGAYVFTGLIPFFGQMNSLIGAVFDPLLCFVLPSIMLYKSGLPMTPLDKVGALFYVFVVGVFAWGPGTGVAIYSIAESSDDVGGPFSCQCIAKQCST